MPLCINNSSCACKSEPDMHWTIYLTVLNSACGNECSTWLVVLADVVRLAENKAVKSLIPTEDAFKVPAIPAPPETIKLPEVVVPEPVVFEITTGPEEITVPKPVILNLSVDKSTVSESV